MNQDQIREALNAQPFRPFTVRMADGTSYPVSARDHIGISPTGQTVIFVGKGFHIVDAAQVVSIVSIEPGVLPADLLEWKQGPLLPVEVARDLWLALHKTRNSSAFEPGLGENEETLYRYLTQRFCCEAAIGGVEYHNAPPA